MIEKKLWSNLIEVLDYTLMRNTRTLLTTLVFDSSDSYRKDTLINVFNETMKLLGYSYPSASLNPSLSSWKDLPIWISSYKPFTRNEYVNKVFFDLMRYINAYSFLLINNGFARSIVRKGALSSSTDSSSKNKDYNSETPQVSSNDEALDNLEYLSNASKSFNTSTSSVSQNDNVEETSKTWEDEKKNLELVYYNDITNYIMRIPYLIYDYFALDTYPYPDAIERFYENLKVIYTNE